MSTLQRYEEACHAVAAARSVDEVLEISNKAEAVRAYARQAKNRDLELDACEIRIRAERRLGQMLMVAKADGILAKGGRPSIIARNDTEPLKITLPEIGIGRRLSARAQALARAPEVNFETQLNRWRAEQSEGLQRVSLHVRRAGKKASGKHGRPEGWPMVIPRRDLRSMTLRDLRALTAFLNALVEQSGSAHDGATVRECVSDAKIRALAEEPIRQ